MVPAAGREVLPYTSKSRSLGAPHACARDGLGMTTKKEKPAAGRQDGFCGKWLKNRCKFSAAETVKTAETVDILEARC